MRVIYEKEHKEKAEEIRKYLSADKLLKLNRKTNILISISEVTGIFGGCLAIGTTMGVLLSKILFKNNVINIYRPYILLIYILSLFFLISGYVLIKIAEQKDAKLQKKIKRYASNDYFNYHLLCERQIPFEVCVCVKYSDDYVIELPEFELIGKGPVIAVNLHSKQIFRGENEINDVETFE